MKNLGKVMRYAQVDNSKWESELLDFLRSYRAAPHKTTGCSPNELLFKTKSAIVLASRLPVVFESNVSGLVSFSPDTVEDEIVKKVRIFDSKRKSKMKAYADKRWRTKELKIQVGDLVKITQSSILK